MNNKYYYIDPKGIKYDKIAIYKKIGIAEGQFINSKLNMGVLLSALQIAEGVSNSQIEGSYVTLSDVYEDYDNPTNNDVREVINLAQGLKEGIALIEKYAYSKRVIIALHKIIMERISGTRKSRQVGQLRTNPVWIGQPWSTEQTATFVPSAANELSTQLSQWEKYLNNPQSDEILKGFISHGWFERIHPFDDGNGRVGRLFLSLYFKNEQICDQFYFLPSLIINKPNFKARYYLALQTIQVENSYTQFNNYMLEVLQAYLSEIGKITQKANELYDEILAEMITLKIQIPSQLLLYFFMNPGFTKANLIKTLKENNQLAVSEKTIDRYLQKLSANQIITPRSSKKGYLFQKYIQILSEF